MKLILLSGAVLVAVSLGGCADFVSELTNPAFLTGGECGTPQTVYVQRQPRTVYVQEPQTVYVEERDNSGLYFLSGAALGIGLSAVAASNNDDYRPNHHPGGRPGGGRPGGHPGGRRR